jgi:hypothetical protein
MQEDWECDAISCELVETANETSETDLSQRMEWHNTLQSSLNQTADEASTKRVPLPRFSCAGLRPGICSLFDRLVTGIDVHTACSHL